MRSDRQQYAGCIIGQALGDALGRPVEGFEELVSLAERCHAIVDE